MAAISDTQAAYIRRVKEALNRELGSRKYSYSQLLSILEERYDFRINKGTLRELFNVSSSSMNYACLITVCAFFGLNLNEFLVPEVINDIGGTVTSSRRRPEKKRPDSIAPFLKSLEPVSGKFSVLRDESYMGDFRGYISTPTRKDAIEEFNLSLYKDPDQIAHARLVRRSSSKRSVSYEYVGIPYHSKAYQSVLIFLTDTKGKGEFYFLTFGFRQYRSEEGLLFRQGLAVTGESLRSGSMVSQNFVLIKNGLSEEDQKYLPGLLRSPVNEFCVDWEKVNTLAEEYPEVRQLMKELSDNNYEYTEEVCIFNEDVILQLNRLAISSGDRIRALLLLKSRSSVPDKNYYVAESKFSGFAANELIGDQT